MTLQTDREERLAEILQRIRAKFQVKFEPLSVGAETLELLEITDMPRHIDALVRQNAIRDPLRDLPLWAKIWPASLVLGNYLRKFPPGATTMLELGAGMGACSLIAARHGFSRITATDAVADALDFASANILRNNLDAIVEARALDISSPGSLGRLGAKSDIICASELLYLEKLHRPILKFVRRQLAPGGTAVFCVEAKRHQPHFAKLAARDFYVSQRGLNLHEAENPGHRQLFVITELTICA